MFTPVYVSCASRKTWCPATPRSAPAVAARSSIIITTIITIIIIISITATTTTTTTVIIIIIIIIIITTTIIGSIEVNGGQWRSMEVNGGQWRSMEVNGGQWRSMEIRCRIGRCISGVNRGQRELKGSFRGYPTKRVWCGVLLTLVSCRPRCLRDLPP